MEPDRRDRVSVLGGLAGRLARWSALRPRRVLLGAGLVLVLALLSLSRLHISSSLMVMLGTRSPAAAAMERVSTQYRSGDALLLLVELPKDRPADDAARMELVEFAMRLERSLMNDPALSASIAWVRFSEDPEWLAYAQEVMLPSGAFYLDDDGAAELVRRLAPEHLREQFARNEALIMAPGPAGTALSAAVLRDPLRLTELIPPRLAPGATSSMHLAPTGSRGAPTPQFSEDGRALLIHIGAANVGSDYSAAGRLAEAVVRRSAELSLGRFRIEPAGFAAIAGDSSRVIRRDSVVSAVVSVGLLYMLFLTFYRRWSAGLVIGGVAAVGMMAGIGAVALVIKEVSPLAAMIAALLAGLGTDYGIHFLSHYDGYREQGLGSVDASVQTSRHMAVPIVTNCFTSIFGFISLWPSKIQMLSDFAVMGAAGLIGALLAVFLLMPAALALIDRRAGAKQAGRAVFGRLADVVAARPRACMASSLVLIAVAISAAAFQGFVLEFESDLTVMHPRPSRALDVTGEVVRRFSSQGELVPIEVRAATPEGLVSAAHEAARAMTTPACRAAGVTSVISLHSLVPDPRDSAARLRMLTGIDTDQAMASFDAALRESAFDPAAYADYRRFLRTLLSARQAPTMDDVLRYRGVADRIFPLASMAAHTPPTSTVLVVRLGTPLHDRAQRKAVVKTLDDAAATVGNARVTVAGIAAVSEELDEAARDGLPQAIALSFALVLLWLTFVFRKPLDVALALLPLLFAASATVLFVIATGQRFNPINSVAIPLLDGIAVDAGVFLVSVYRAHGSTRGELTRHLRSTTHAVLLSVGTTATAFASLCFAHTPAVQSLGFVSAVGILASGVGALLLLMPILIRRVPEATPP